MTPATQNSMSAWTLTQEISISTHIRLYQTDKSGKVVNQTRDRVIPKNQPNRPWAIYLADGVSYHYLCFDLDRHHVESVSQVNADQQTITRLLNKAGIAYLVCQSGPAGGRHIWTASLDALDATLVASIAAKLSLICPTLDITPLVNPKTGCARPPLSPHRAGGVSTPIEGTLDTLTMPQTSEEAYVRFENLTNKAAAEHAKQNSKPARKTDHTGQKQTNTRVGSDGDTLYLVGRRRPLSSRAQQLLETPIGSGQDRSSIQYSILLAAALACWHYEDIAALITKPGMAHSLTSNTGRIRESKEARRILKADWNRAVKTTATLPTHAGNSQAWLARTEATMQAVQAQQAMSKGFDWSHGIAPSARRILMALHLYMLQACKTSVQADIRRLALDTGVSRETARKALTWLTQLGLIRQTDAAYSTQAAEWSLKNTTTTTKTASFDQALPQVNTPPEETLTARTQLIEQTSSWLTTASHDAHTSTPARLHAGNTLADATSSLTSQQREQLHHRLDTQARWQGTLGTGRQRKETYTAERLAWAWWQTEHTWMTKPASLTTRTTRATRLLPHILKGVFPPHPRTGNHARADWHAALQQAHQWATQA